MTTKRPAPEWTEYDLRALGRLVKKYGLKQVQTEAEAIPLPQRGRPKADADENREFLMDVVYCLKTWAAEHKTAGNKAPIEEAFLELYKMIVEDKLQKTSGHYERWRQTVKRNLRRHGRRDYEDFLKWARLTGPLISGK